MALSDCIVAAEDERADGHFSTSQGAALCHSTPEPAAAEALAVKVVNSIARRPGSSHHGAVPNPAIPQLRDNQSVILTTLTGTPISIGRIGLAKRAESDGAPRVEISFETEKLKCTLGVSPRRVDELLASWDGARYRYELSASEQIWLGDGKHATVEVPGPPIIETFPVPVKAVLPTRVTPLRKINVVKAQA